MSEQRYRLIFRGEALEDQHPAVVKKRLTESLRLGEQAAEKLFSGRPVVVKKDVTAEDAARFQALFKKAGAQLHVQSMSGESAEPDQGEGEEPEGLRLLPVGTDLLAPGERRTVPVVEVDTGELEMQPPGTPLVETSAPEPAAAAAPDYTIADTGSDLLDGTAREIEELDIGDVDFELADPGADLDTQPAPETPPAPDTSHLSLSADPDKPTDT